MGAFDQFNPALASNGQAAPNPQVTSGAPGFQFGNWGHQPPNMAGGLQQFLAAKGMARPQPGAPPQQSNAAQPPQPGAAPMPNADGSPGSAPMGAGAPQQGITYGNPSFAGGMSPFLNNTGQN